MIQTNYTTEVSDARVPDEWLPDNVMIRVKGIVNDLKSWNESGMPYIHKEGFTLKQDEGHWYVTPELPLSNFYEVKELSCVTQLRFDSFVKRIEPTLNPVHRERLRKLREQFSSSLSSIKQEREKSESKYNPYEGVTFFKTHLIFGAEISDIEAWKKITTLFPWNRFVYATKVEEKIVDIWKVKGRFTEPEIFAEFIDKPFIQRFWIEYVDKIPHSIPPIMC